MKLELTSEQLQVLRRGNYVTVTRAVGAIPHGIMERLQLLADYPVKNRMPLDGVCEGETTPLIVGMVRLNIADSCIEFDVYDQHEVVL